MVCVHGEGVGVGVVSGGAGQLASVSVRASCLAHRKSGGALVGLVEVISAL